MPRVTPVNARLFCFYACYIRAVTVIMQFAL